MKKAVLILALTTGLMAFNTQTEKSVTVTMDKARAERAFNQLRSVQMLMEESNLPHQQVKYVTSVCDSLIMEIARGYQLSIADSTKAKK